MLSDSLRVEVLINYRSLGTLNVPKDGLVGQWFAIWPGARTLTVVGDVGDVTQYRRVSS